MKKVGIYAGSFDPVHNGHVDFALKAIEQCKLDKVFFLPEPRPRYKQGVKALVHRVAMVRLAIELYPKLGLIELDQSRFYVNDTLPVLQARFKGAELHFLLGDDKLKRLVNWPSISVMAEQTRFVIGSRHGQEQDVERLAKLLELAGGPRLRHSFVKLRHTRTSSSNIRKQLKNGQIPDSLDAKVLQYITNQKLYSVSGSSS